MGPTVRKVFLVSKDAWSIYNSRIGLIRELKKQGFEVVAVATPDDFGPVLEELGIRFISFRLAGKGINPVRELITFFKFLALYRKEKPTLTHHFTIKPIIYGSIAARFTNVPVVINTITGLGFVFRGQTKRWMRIILRPLYRLALNYSSFTFFQNSDDRRVLIEQNIVQAKKCMVVPGSGVNTLLFDQRQSDDSGEKEDTTSILMIGRLLKDKGIYEYVEACRLLHEQFPNLRCKIVGKYDVSNPTVVPKNQLLSWQEERIIEWLEVAKDIRPIIAKADIVVLPSYHEGLSRSLLEAAAMAKPIVTTNIPGCRETVDDQRTGFIVPIKDGPALAGAISILVQNPALRVKMGRAGRQKIKREFDERMIVKRTMETYRKTLRNSLYSHGAFQSRKA